MLLDKASKDADAGRITAEDFEAASHGPEFGVCFAAVWRVVSLRILPRMHEVGVAGWGWGWILLDGDNKVLAMSVYA
jgi:hypothetical protein